MHILYWKFHMANSQNAFIDFSHGLTYGGSRFDKWSYILTC